MMTTNKDKMMPKIMIDEKSGCLFFVDSMILNETYCHGAGAVVAAVRWELREHGKWVAGMSEVDIYITETAAMPSVHERYATLGMAMTMDEAICHTGRNAVGVQSTVLDVSNCHITQKDSENLSDSKVVIVYDKPDYGWFVYCGYGLNEISDKVAEIKAEGLLSEGFCNVLRRGCFMGCKWIELDCDGTVWDGLLDVYDW